MSGLGQNRKWRAVRGESALARITDMQGLLQHVRSVPISDIADQLFHSMISSARPMSEFGTVSPKALAVFKLMASSTFVSC
jgi:hypothetical protein